MLYARSDLNAVTLGPAHGGCGTTHERPLDDTGRRVSVWALECPACEQHLAGDTKAWGFSVAEVPMTVDEVRQRDADLENGRRNQGMVTTQALNKLAQLGELPNALAKLTQLLEQQSGTKAGAA